MTGTAPDFAYQTGAYLNPDSPFAKAWVKEVSRQMREDGATYLRLSRHGEHYHLLLLEGWKIRPAEEPPPHFFLVPA